jgi:hypothetical protein
MMMPRPAKGPRLYLRKESDGTKKWIIRDRNRDTRTGFSEHQRDEAAHILDQYLAGKFRPKRSKPTGTIYFVTCLSSANYPIKIGWTLLSAEGRLMQLQCGNPNLMTMVATLVGTQEDERKLHFYFAHLHVRGEWFMRGADLLDYIGGLPGQVETYGAEEFDDDRTSISVRRTTTPASTDTNCEQN